METKDDSTPSMTGTDRATVPQFTVAVLLTAAAAIVLRGRPWRRPRTRSERVWPPADRP